MLKRKFFAVILLLSALLATRATQAAPLYTATLLPGVDFAPTGMNNAGQIVGFAGDGAGAIHTVLYQGGVLSDLGSMGGRDSYALAVNEAGAMTGAVMTANGEAHAFLYQNGQVTELESGTVGYGINARGDIVGKKQTANGWTGFLFSDGKLTALGNLGTGLDGFAVDINDHGKIVGESSIADGVPAPTRRPYLYRHGDMTDLGALSDRDNNGAVAINNRGQVAGYSEGPDGFMHAFLYQHGAMQDLGSLGDAALDIHDLNEHGTLVGTASNEEDGLIPFMNLGGALVDLNTLLDPVLGWHIFSAYANNDLGQIVGYGCRDAACGLVRLDLTSAVPAPGGALLWLAGLTALACARQRQRRARASRRMLRRAILALAMVPALLLPALAQADALYTIHVLPENFYPSDINNAGQIAGIATIGDGNAHAAIYAGGVVTNLASFGADYVDVVAITDAGTVLGNVSPTVGGNRAFVYSNGSLQEIAGLYAYGINASGDIVGENGGAVLYSQGTLTELGHLGTGDFSTARGINDAGDIVGTSTIDLDFHSRQHPFLYRDGTLHDLGTLDEREFNSAVAINNAGQIAGYSEGAGGGMHAFFYENGVMTDLGSFGGLNLSVGGMNEHGQVVGTGEPWEGDRVGFISRNGALVDLNTLIDPAPGWQIGGATAINDNGQILAYACRDFECTNVRLDLASAVPEPLAAGMLVSGLLALGTLWRRQHRRAVTPGMSGAVGLIAVA